MISLQIALPFYCLRGIYRTHRDLFLNATYHLCYFYIPYSLHWSGHSLAHLWKLSLGGSSIFYKAVKKTFVSMLHVWVPRASLWRNNNHLMCYKRTIVNVFLICFSSTVSTECFQKEKYLIFTQREGHAELWCCFLKWQMRLLSNCYLFLVDFLWCARRIFLCESSYMPHTYFSFDISCKRL